MTTTTDVSRSSPAATERLHALDAIRSFALLLGIVLHATMSFFLPIPALDNSPSTTLGVTFFTIHIFRMSLFFIIAGFFAHLVFHRKGGRAFHRQWLLPCWLAPRCYSGGWRSADLRGRGSAPVNS